MFTPTTPSAPGQHPVKDVDPRESTVLGFAFAWDLGYTIAIPAVVFGLGGGYLDRHFNSSPAFLLLGLFIAFVTSFIVVARKVKAILARMPKTLPKKKKQSIPVDVALEQSALHDLFRPPSE